VVLIHATFNFPITLLFERLGSQMTLPFLLYVGLTVVAAIMMVIVYGPQHLCRKHHKQEEGGAEPVVATPGVVTPTPA
jgi:hypothetical protein